MSRGLSPIISVILLLMMTVSIGAAAFFWMAGMANSISNRVERTADTELGRLEFDLKLADYDLECNDTLAGQTYTTGAKDGRIVSNITLMVMGYGSTTKKELDTISIKSVVIDGKIVNDGDYLEGKDITFQSGELLKIKINNTDSYGRNPVYVNDLKINESDADATADNPMHKEEVTFLFSTDRGTVTSVKLELDANKKCL